MTEQNQDGQGRGEGGLGGRAGQGGQTQFRSEGQDGQQNELESQQATSEVNRMAEDRSFQGAGGDPVEGGRDQGLDGGDTRQAAGGAAGGSKVGDEDKDLDADDDSQAQTSNT